jgi:hypothetical protein
MSRCLTTPPNSPITHRYDAINFVETSDFDYRSRGVTHIILSECNGEVEQRLYSSRFARSCRTTRRKCIPLHSYNFSERTCAVRNPGTNYGKSKIGNADTAEIGAPYDRFYPSLRPKSKPPTKNKLTPLATRLYEYIAAISSATYVSSCATSTRLLHDEDGKVSYRFPRIIVDKPAVDKNTISSVKNATTL